MKAQSRIERTRIYNKLPVAREGLPFICIGAILSLVLFPFHVEVLTGLAILLTLFTLYFFRDPDRRGEIRDGLVLSPADGRVIDIQSFDNGLNLLGEPAVRVSVFMSIFNVHVNRIPISGTIAKISYHPGKFVSANLDKSSEENENNRITLVAPGGRKVVVVQIAGLIARRIACWVREGEEVVAGNRFGLIRFGSRLDVYLPSQSRILVQPNEKVKAGETILGYLP